MTPQDMAILVRVSYRLCGNGNWASGDRVDYRARVINADRRSARNILDLTSRRIVVPVQVAPGHPIRVRGASDASGGHTLMSFCTVRAVREFMSANPQAAMPAWRNPLAIWNTMTV